MIQFDSILKNELSEFLSIREVSLSKSTFDHDCYYLKNLTIILYVADAALKNLQKT